jgi:hypothetical protein
MSEQHDAYVAYMAIFPGQHDAWVAMCPCGWRSSRGNEGAAWRYRDEHRRARPAPAPDGSA